MFSFSSEMPSFSPSWSLVGQSPTKYSAKGWAFTLMDLDPQFFPVPPLSSHDPSFCFPCPSPIAKKNNPITVASWHNQIKTTELIRKTWKGSPKVWIALHRELSTIKIKCTPSKKIRSYVISIKTCAYAGQLSCHNLEVCCATAICSC